MSLTEKITLLHNELSQRQKAQSARAKLQNFRNVVLETNMAIKEIADSGDFNTLDIDIKSALVAAWNVCKVAETALEDAAIAELLDWSPGI